MDWPVEDVFSDLYFTTFQFSGFLLVNTTGISKDYLLATWPLRLRFTLAPSCCGHRDSCGRCGFGAVGHLAVWLQMLFGHPQKATLPGGYSSPGQRANPDVQCSWEVWHSWGELIQSEGTWSEFCSDPAIMGRNGHPWSEWHGLGSGGTRNELATLGSSW